MKAWDRIRYLTRVNTLKPKRYANLLKIVFQNKCRRIMEIGVFDGAHAKQMIEIAKMSYSASEVEYIGFDLFELLSSRKLEEEFSKRPPSCQEVQDFLDKTGARILLYMGDTKQTISEYKDKLKNIDFIFIDGGHSIETITSDWNHVEDLMSEKTIVVFDDYYMNEEPAIQGLGCKIIIDYLDPEIYEVEILKPMDRFKKEWGVLNVNMVKVVRKSL